MKQMHILSRRMLAVGIILILISVGFAVYSILFISRATRAEGIVINLVERITKQDNITSITYRPEVEFLTKDGESKTFLSSFSSNPPRYDIGNKVNVLYYDEGGKINAKISSFWTLWFFPLFWFYMGLFFGIIAISILYSLKTGKPMGVSYYSVLKREELWYCFKLNKLCPICNRKLAKEKRKIDRGIGVCEVVDGYMYGQRYEIKYWYRCNVCEKSFPIEELASSGKS